MTAHEPRIAALSGLRRAIYFTALSRGLTPDKAYRAASSRCCQPSSGEDHTAACLASWEQE